MGGGADVKIPDYKIYKVDGIKELERTRDLLAKRGLKDPWLRNEVWRYAPENFCGTRTAMLRSLGRGFKFGLAAFVLTVIAEKAYHQAYPVEHEHH